MTLIYEKVWEYEYQSRSKSIQVNQRQQSPQCFATVSSIQIFQPFFALISKPSVSSIPCGGSNFALVLGSKVPKMESKSLDLSMTSAHKPHKRCQKLENTTWGVKNSVLSTSVHWTQMGLIHVPKHFLGLSRPVGFIHNWKHAKKKVLVDLLPGPSQGLCFLLIQVLDGIKVWWQVKVAVILLILSLSMKISMTIYDYHILSPLSITIYHNLSNLPAPHSVPKNTAAGGRPLLDDLFDFALVI